MALDETSSPSRKSHGGAARHAELLIAVARDAPGTLGSQIEDQLREAIRGGSLRPGARVPSTRDLARQLGISRRVAVDAYAQLAAEGYLLLRQGARPRVSDAVAAATPQAAAPPPPPPRFDFLPSVPDVSAFPRGAWQRALREAVAAIADADLGYGDHRGVGELREALADYLGRVRGVVAAPASVVVTSGYTQGLGLVCHAIAARGGTRIAIEDPSNPDQALIAARAGLEPVPVGVDEDGIDVDALAASDADGVILTPAHQHPTGVVLSPDRRAALVRWLRDQDAIAIEDDYDAEYRYDRAAVGALQGLDPDRVVYAGSASKTLAPALRLGWLVVPPGLIAAVTHEKTLSDRGTARVEQLALASFLARGELDRHLRRMRARYTARRDALVEELAAALPQAEVLGIAAGLHATVRLAGDASTEVAIRAAAARRRLQLELMSDYRPGHDGPATLLLGYAQMPEPAIRAGVRELAEAVREAEVRTAAATTQSRVMIVSMGEPALESRDWIGELRGASGPRDTALADLHELLLRAARFELSRRSRQLAGVAAHDRDDLATQAADDALVAVLAKLDDFAGRSRFTTWAYKFALLEAGVKARRRAWQGREVELTEHWPEPAGHGRSAHERLEERELMAALREAITADLTPRQRDVFVALALNEVPIDVLAERLGSTRGALYKTLHDARRKLRAALTAAGHIAEESP